MVHSIFSTELASELITFYRNQSVDRLFLWFQSRTVKASLGIVAGISEAVEFSPYEADAVSP